MRGENSVTNTRERERKEESQERDKMERTACE